MKRPNRRAFTLLELLVALAMSATIAGALATSLYVAFRARTSAERAIEQAHVTDAIGDIVARDIASALPPTGILAGSFTGTADAVGFYCPGTESRSSLLSDCRYVEFALASDGTSGGGNLVRRVNTNLLAQIQEEPAEERICRNIQELVFLYSDGSSWLESWDSTEHDNTLPMAVQISVTFKAEEGHEAAQAVRIVRLACGVIASTTDDGGGAQ